MHNTEVTKNTNLTPDQNCTVNTYSIVEKRFMLWLVSRKYVGDTIQNDGLGMQDINNLNDLIFSEKDRKSAHQRILLDVEKKGFLDRQSKKAQRADDIVRAQSLISKASYSDLIKQTNNEKNVVSDLLNFSIYESDLLNLIFTPAATFSSLANIIDSNLPSLAKRLILTVNSSSFLKAASLPKRNIKDTRSALAFIGINGIRTIIPLLIFKSKMKFYNSELPQIPIKLWAYILTVANIAGHLSSVNNVSSPEKMSLAALIYLIGNIAVVNQFDKSWNNGTKLILQKLRASNNPSHRKIYFAIHETKHNASLIVSALKHSSAKAGQFYADKIEYDHIKDVKNGVNDTDSAEHKILVNAIHCAKLALLHEHKLIKNDEIASYLKYCEIPVNELIKIVKSKPHQLKIRTS